MRAQWEIDSIKIEQIFVRLLSAYSRILIEFRSMSGFYKGCDEELVMISQTQIERGVWLRALMATPAIGRKHPSSFPAECHYSRDRKSRVRNRLRTHDIAAM